MGEKMEMAMGEEEDGEEFLEEVMEVRGQVDAAREEGELEEVRAGNEGRVGECVGGLERGFEELGRVEKREYGDGGGGKEEEVERVVRGLVRETVRLRYWIGVREGIDGWEKGRGGGVLRH